MDNAVAKVADGATGKPSRAAPARGARRELLAALLRQERHDRLLRTAGLGSNRTTMARRSSVRSGALTRERSVHLEAWGVQALADTLDSSSSDRSRPTRRNASCVLRSRRTRMRASAARGLDALDRLEAARDAVAAAPPESLAEALRALDETFVELTGREPVRNPGRAYGARTLAYIDCMRDIDVTLGTQLLDRASRRRSRCCSKQAGGTAAASKRSAERVIEACLPAGGRGPFAPVLGRVLGSLMALPPEIKDEVAELQRRLAACSPTPIPRRCGASGRRGVRRSPAVLAHRRFSVSRRAGRRTRCGRGQLGATTWRSSATCIPGANPLMQGVFAHRHPDAVRAAADDRGRYWARCPAAPAASSRRASASTRVGFRSPRRTTSTSQRYLTPGHSSRDGPGCPMSCSSTTATSSIAQASCVSRSSTRSAWRSSSRRSATFELLPDDRARTADDDRTRRAAP